MIGPPAYVPKRNATAWICSLIGAASLVFAIAAASAAGDDSRDAANARRNASGSASAASSSASVAASLPSPQDVRARFPLPAGTTTRPDDPPGPTVAKYYTHGLTFEQVRAFYENTIPKTFPTLTCRFEAFSPTQQECGLREDVDFGHIDVWSTVDGIRPGEVFVRLTIG